MIRLDDIDRALGARKPTVADPGSAVAAILCNAESPQLLFIERARVEGDPWSGDIAFPGGRVEPQDDGLQAAAERETREEIGIHVETFKKIITSASTPRDHKKPMVLML